MLNFPSFLVATKAFRPMSMLAHFLTRSTFNLSTVRTVFSSAGSKNRTDCRIVSTKPHKKTCPQVLAPTRMFHGPSLLPDSTLHSMSGVPTTPPMFSSCIYLTFSSAASLQQRQLSNTTSRLSFSILEVRSGSSRVYSRACSHSSQFQIQSRRRGGGSTSQIRAFVDVMLVQARKSRRWAGCGTGAAS